MVAKRDNESFEGMMRRFKKKVSKSGLLKELKYRMEYEKPCDKRNRKLRESIRKIKNNEQQKEQKENRRK